MTSESSALHEEAFNKCLPDVCCQPQNSSSKVVVIPIQAHRAMSIAVIRGFDLLNVEPKGRLTSQTVRYLGKSM